MPPSLKTIIFASIIFGAGFIWISSASAGDNICDTQDWAYSDTIGWISFDCATSPPESASCNASWQEYGVKIQDTGYLKDYAWNGYIKSWISFADFDGNGIINNDDNNASSICAPNCLAQYNSGDNQIYGWARILGLTTAPGGGWIKLNCKTIANGQTTSECSVSNYGVSFRSCEFRGWAWSDDIGWICFNCQDDEESTACSFYPEYRVNCRESATQAFKLTKVSLDSYSPCRVDCLTWERVPDAEKYEVNYTVKRKEGEGPWEIMGSCLDHEDPECNPDNENCTPCCSGDTCFYCQTNLGPTPETAYTFKISTGLGVCGKSVSNQYPTTTTICAPLLDIVDPGGDRDPKKYACEKKTLDLIWTEALGTITCDENGNNCVQEEGADEGYVLYEAIGGDNYKKIKTIAMGDPSYDGTYYHWILSEEYCSDPYEQPDPRCFKVGEHYYFFVRGLDSNDHGIDLDVDSNRVDICCLTVNP